MALRVKISSHFCQKVREIVKKVLKKHKKQGHRTYNSGYSPSTGLRMKGLEYPISNTECRISKLKNPRNLRLLTIDDFSEPSVPSVAMSRISYLVRKFPC